MKALISTNEQLMNGFRIAQVCEEEFEVHESLMWVDCDDTVTPDMFWYDPSDSSIKPVIAEVSQ